MGKERFNDLAMISNENEFMHELPDLNRKITAKFAQMNNQLQFLFISSHHFTGESLWFHSNAFQVIAFKVFIMICLLPMFNI